MSASDWAIFDRCGDEIERWADRKRQMRQREPSGPKPRHPVADESPPRTVGDGPPTPGWPDDDDEPGPEDSGRFGPN